MLIDAVATATTTTIATTTTTMTTAEIALTDAVTRARVSLTQSTS